jgi:hypothetical protein
VKQNWVCVGHGGFGGRRRGSPCFWLRMSCLPCLSLYRAFAYFCDEH